MREIEAVDVKEFMRHTPKELSRGMDGHYDVLFDDDIVLHLHYREIVLSRYLWEILRKYRDVPITSKFSITEHYDKGMLTTKSTVKALSTILNDITTKVLEFDRPTLQRNLVDLWYDIFSVQEKLYSELSFDIMHKTISVDSADMLDFQHNTELMSVMNDYARRNEIGDYPTTHDISSAYKLIDKIVYSDMYKDNPLCKAYKVGSIRHTQVFQVFGPRGYVSDLDNTIFRKPIVKSFMLGLKDMYDMIVDSKAGGKAAYLATVAVRESEYIGRLLQIIAMYVERVTQGDCKSTEYNEWRVSGPENSNSGDLSNMIGKYYLDEETNTLKMIKGDETHLTDKIIKVRTPMKCKLREKSHVCSTCFGGLSNSIPWYTNIGHLSAVTITAIITQAILSTKHENSSAVSDNIVLSNDNLRLFSIKHGNGYVFNKRKYKKNETMVIKVKASELSGLKDITKDKVKNISPERISKIITMVVMNTVDDDKENFLVPVKLDNRYGYFTTKFLEYIMDNHTLDSKGDYYINMRGWTYVSPILYVSNVEFSYVTLIKDIKTMLTKDIMKVKGGRSSSITPEALMDKLFTHINSKLNVNMAYIEIIVYAFMVKDLYGNNMDLARGAENPQLATMTNIVNGRSFGGAMGHNNLIANLINTDMLKSKNKPSHVMDILIDPVNGSNEVTPNRWSEYRLR